MNLISPRNASASPMPLGGRLMLAAVAAVARMQRGGEAPVVRREVREAVTVVQAAGRAAA